MSSPLAPLAVTAVLSGLLLSVLVWRHRQHFREAAPPAQSNPAPPEDFSSFFAAAPIPLVAYDSSTGRLLAANAAARTVYGLRAGDPLDAICLEHLHRELRGCLPTDVSRHEVSLTTGQGVRLFEAHFSPGGIPGSSGAGAMTCVLVDVTLERANAAALRTLAATDSLTGLLGRSGFAEVVSEAVSGQRDGALLYIDLDGFKAVNDRYGHGMGDALLTAVARRLSSGLRQGDTAARLGGDEFAVLLVRDGAHMSLADVAQRLVVQLSAPYFVRGMVVEVGASAGLAPIEPGLKPEQLIARADKAMYDAKHHGRRRLVLQSGESRRIS